MESLSTFGRKSDNIVYFGFPGHVNPKKKL